MCPHSGENTYPRVPKTWKKRTTPTRDRDNGHKTVPVVYHWTNGARWRNPSTSNEVMKMKMVNRKLMNHPEGTLTL
ncbi:hypothetical protein MsedC_0870 [Metallosphaera sedula]|uniref:Uncharacterized protein n=2 Tax=Metallosphaera TaxID=41980 RepID=A0A0K1SH79_9CREN|nr:hypothetical protein MsedA_0870 [Metallosphaera sedula]AKV76175.1 hypothetical protein MsedB_0871 [Metallosphaera sedula]AKV78426.1 hypothetical protein MsedC_0870 [Metallosphaera sedula]AKV80671.1 hypothetical protein MsedD_0871 [Metallosphaera sedula]QCO29472.1 hypothetical protein DFR88_02280 [Metallosphaera prunae]